MKYLPINPKRDEKIQNINKKEKKNKKNKKKNEKKKPKRGGGGGGFSTSYAKAQQDSLAFEKYEFEDEKKIREQKSRMS